MKLDKLLYILCEKGWKPYGISRVKNVVALNHCICFSKRTIFGIEFFEYTLRSLVSKESGLWQFVCENKLVNVGKTYIMAYTKRFRDVYELKKDEADEYSDTEYEYWLIESSLRDESELEQFLLDNIKVEGK